MSHEIRTPMNAILGLAYLLEKRSLPRDAHEMIRKIRTAGRSLQGIINDILDFSKIESGKLELENAPFQLGDVLENIATIMSANAGDKTIELLIGPPPQGALQLRGDALRIEQILINLTGNAIKFTDHGHVHLAIRRLPDVGQRVVLRFAVEDSGIGITPAMQQELFKPFSQADASTTRRYGGTGLGLAISRRLVALMGGEIGVNSVPGKGSEFWFTVAFDPMLDEELSVPELAHLNVVIADDNPVALEVMESIASARGWHVTAVDSGAAALDAIRAMQREGMPCDVAVLDWKMPEVDGLA
ncbi:MAG: response regulator, partial [Sulfuritalea sp.]|nr:response regulator [Sulfuritalea sp.]